MASALGYDDAGRSKLDRILKKKTVKIDPQTIEDVQNHLHEEYGDEEWRGPPPDPIPMDLVTFEVQEEEDRYVTAREVDGTYVIDPAEIDEMLAEDLDLFVVLVEGDSMEPEFRSGDRLVVRPVPERERYSIRVDGIYLFRLEDTVQIKRLQRLPGKKIRVLSTSDKYESYDVDLAEDPDVEVIGRVYGHFKRY
jgi:phage repressor protein C with HTH and peptisase S24 domain